MNSMIKRDSIKELKFEAALEELEKIVSKLDSGDLSLEDSIEAYEVGTELKAHCEKQLKAAELKILKVTNKETIEVEELKKEGSTSLVKTVLNLGQTMLIFVTLFAAIILSIIILGLEILLNWITNCACNKSLGEMANILNLYIVQFIFKFDNA